MKKITTIPKHYRRLKYDEVAKPGDLCLEPGNLTVYRVDAAWKVNQWPDWKFFRRQHVKVQVNQPVIDKPVAPLVEFEYPISHQPWMLKRRTVRLIGANGTYLIGLDFTYRDGKDHWQFKKFLRHKIRRLGIVEFNPDAVK